VEKCASERNHFKLAQAMFKKEFLKISRFRKPIKLPDTRTKKPTICNDIDETRTKWSN